MSKAPTPNYYIPKQPIRLMTSKDWGGNVTVWRRFYRRHTFNFNIAVRSMI